jgi:hypothetical protein
MQIEYDDQIKRRTFIIIISSHDVKSITDKWVYKIKKNSDESISRFKVSEWLTTTDKLRELIMKRNTFS